MDYCLQVQSSNFTQNTAKSSGSVLLADDDSQISFTNSAFTSNGNYSCYDPPTVQIWHGLAQVIAWHLQKNLKYMGSPDAFAKPPIVS